jgi:hypothetical protein
MRLLLGLFIGFLVGVFQPVINFERGLKPGYVNGALDSIKHTAITCVGGK